MLTRHHLIPRTRHRNKRNQKRFTRETVRERVTWLCRPCHKQIHSLIGEKELEQTYNTIESLAVHPGMARFVRWIADKPARLHVRSVRSGSRGGRLAR